jgi:hypothetical protein
VRAFRSSGLFEDIRFRGRRFLRHLDFNRIDHSVQDWKEVIEVGLVHANRNCTTILVAEKVKAFLAELS